MLQVEAVHLVGGADDDEVAGVLRVRDGAALSREPGLVVVAELGVEHDAAVGAQEGHLGVVVAEDVKVDNLGVEVPLELHGQLGQVVHLDLRRVNPRHGEEVPVPRQSHPRRRGGELEVLHQLDAALVVRILPELALVGLGEPLGDLLAPGDLIDLDAVGGADPQAAEGVVVPHRAVVLRRTPTTTAAAFS